MSTAASLKQEIEQVASAYPITFGVAIKYLETGEEVSLNAERQYQLASVFKVPILVAAMRQLDSARIALDTRIALRDVHKVSSWILSHMDEGLRLTVKDLLTLMIIVSDNTATDIVLDLVGGPAAVNESLRELGFAIDDINISMSVHQLFLDVFGTSENIVLPSESLKRSEEKGVNWCGEVYREGASINVATPLAMNRLYELLFNGEAASRSSCDVALGILLRQQLNWRLPCELPPGVDVAHKTGTMMGVRNDSGIIYASEGQHIAVTVLTRELGTPTGEFDGLTSEGAIRLDRAIGRIGRLAVDFGRKLATDRQ